MLVIVGNPPYNGKSKNNYDIDEYKQIDGEKLNEKNIRNLNDDYVKFIRFAQRKMDNVEQGIVGIVVNNGFLNNITFRGMRNSLLKTFDSIYIINLHGSSKKNSHNGVVDKNIFNIPLGVCVVIFVKNKNSKLENGVFYKDIYGNKKSKCEWLENNTLKNVDFIKLNPQKPNQFFIPFCENKAYNTFYEIKKIFRKSGSGIETKKDKLVIDFDKEDLLKRLVDFANLTEDEAREKYKLGKDGRDWKVRIAQAALRKRPPCISDIRPICYRPFDNRYIYYPVDMKKGTIAYPRYNIMQHMIKGENIGINFQRTLKNSSKRPLVSDKVADLHATGDSNNAPLHLYEDPPAELRSVIGRPRYDLMQHMLKGENIGINFQRKLISKTKRPQISAHVSDKNLLQGAANLVSLHLYENAPVYEKVENIHPDFRKFIDEKYGRHYTPGEIFGYIYGVLYSDFYQTKYIDYLRCDFARIPFANSTELFESLSKLGWELIEMHLMKTIPNEDGGEYKSEGNDVITKVFFENNRVYINHNSYFDNVPEEIWNFDVGSYRVIPHYLKARKNRVLAPDEIDHLEKVIKILKATVTQIKRIDDVYKKIDSELC